MKTKYNRLIKVITFTILTYGSLVLIGFYTHWLVAVSLFIFSVCHNIEHHTEYLNDEIRYSK